MFSVRHTASRIVTRWTRPFSSKYNAAVGRFNTDKDADIKNRAFTLIDVPDAAPDIRPVYVSSSFGPSTKSKTSNFMNIPPAEDPLLHFMASFIMKRGKRARASRIVSRTLLHIHAYTKAPALPILRHALFSLAPAVRTMNHKWSTKMVHKPVPLTEKQSIWRAVYWLLEACKHRRTGDTLEERLAREIIDIVQNPETNSTLMLRAKAHEHAMINRGSVSGRPR